MLEKYDPGLITGTIGAVIGIMLASIFEKSKIVHRFSKLRKILKDELEDCASLLRIAEDLNQNLCFAELSNLVREASEMVRDERDVPPWFCVIRRYREDNKMAKLISKIEIAQSLRGQTFYLQQIPNSHQEQTSLLLRTLTSRQEQISSLLVQANQVVARTDTAEEMTNEEKPMPAVLRRQKKVLNLMIKDEKSKRKAMGAIASVEGVESVAVDRKENKITVIGEADPVFLKEKLREFVFTELLSVGPAKEEKKAEGKKNEGAKEYTPAVVYMNPSSY